MIVLVLSETPLPFIPHDETCGATVEDASEGSL